MRLTDLLRGKKEVEKTTDKMPDQKTDHTPLSPAPEKPSSHKSVKNGAAHLQAEDLGALYDVENLKEDRGASSVLHTEQDECEGIVTPGKEKRSADDNVDTKKTKTPPSPYERVNGTISEVSMPHLSNLNMTENELQTFDDKTLSTIDDSLKAASNREHEDFERVFSENIENVEIAEKIHTETLSILDDIYIEGKDGKELTVERLIKPISYIIKECRSSNELLRKAVRLKKETESFTAHSLNVTILTIKIGIYRGFSDEKLFSMALCSLLGDIGMTRVEPSILNTTEKLTSQEFEEITKHVQCSVEIVSSISDKFPFLTPIIYQIHERENGKGYPKGLKGENIHEIARIIGMCDVYIALTEQKVNRENYSGYVALQQIISRRNVDFNPKTIKLLIEVISVFPLESLVKLNNGAIGRVIDISPIHPTRPKLSILINSDEEKLLSPKLLDLEKEPLLYIEDPDIEEGVVL